MEDDTSQQTQPRKESVLSNISKRSNLGNPGSPSSQWTPKRRMAVMAVIISTIGSFGLGMTLVWSAIALKYLKDDKEFGEITDTQASLIASIIYLGALMSAPITGFLITTIGRKKTMLISAIPCVIGWVLIAGAQNLWMIYLGRFITGFCGGSITVAVPMYVSEVTEDSIRGTLGTVMILMLVTGIEFTFIVGAFVGWFWLTIVCGIVPIIFFICMLFMPESPRYLIITRQGTAARRALQWLRRASTKRHIEPEISQIQDSIESKCKDGEKEGSTIGDILNPRVLKPLFVSITLMGFSQFSGVNGISLYTSEVFKKAGTEMDPRFALIIIFGGQAISVLIVTFFLVESLKRKTLLLVSQGVMIIGLLGFGLSFFLQVDNKVPEGWEWMPLTSLATFIVGYNIGMGPIPWLVTTEILPPRVRELASSIVTLFYWALSFIAGITFVPLENSLGNYTLYWGSAGVCIIGALFIIFTIPETKGKSNEEIEKYFATASNNSKINEGLELENGFGISNPNFQEVDITT